MNIEAIRILADDADVAIDGPMLKFAELVIERCAIVAERCDDGDAVAVRIRDFFEVDDEFLDPLRALQITDHRTREPTY